MRSLIERVIELANLTTRNADQTDNRVRGRKLRLNRQIMFVYVYLRVIFTVGRVAILFLI